MVIEIKETHLFESNDETKDSLGSSELKEKFPIADKEEYSIELQNPMLCDEENDDKSSFIKPSNYDNNENSKSKKAGGITFSSGDLCRRDLLSSPTASRTFGLGSLDIIMDHDKENDQDCQKYEK